MSSQHVQIIAFGMPLMCVKADNVNHADFSIHANALSSSGLPEEIGFLQEDLSVSGVAFVYARQ
jgi:hypothetical protein